MADQWKFVSEETENISLCDHQITQVEETGPDLVVHFARDGFDVMKDNSLNPTGRHRNTGPAAAVLKNWDWTESASSANGSRVLLLDGKPIPLPVVSITREQFLHSAELEVFYFAWEPAALELKVLRFTNAEIEESFSEVCKKIQLEVERRQKTI